MAPIYGQLTKSAPIRKFRLKSTFKIGTNLDHHLCLDDGGSKQNEKNSQWFLNLVNKNFTNSKEK